MSESQSTCSDEELGRAAGQDVAGAFEQLLRRFQAPLLGFLRRFANSLQEAEDLLQESVLRLYASRRHYRTRWKYKTWAFTIARRVAIDAQRRRAAEARALTRHTVELPPPPPATPIAGDASDGIWAIARRVLTLEQADALWLFHVEEIPPREIARVLDRSWVSVKTMLHRARKAVRAEMIAGGHAELATVRGGTS